MRIVPTQNLEFTQVLGKLSAWCHAVGAKGPYPNFSEALQLGVSSAMRIIPKMNRWSIPNSIQLAVFLSCSPCSPKAENLIPPRVSRGTSGKSDKGTKTVAEESCATS